MRGSGENGAYLFAFITNDMQKAHAKSCVCEKTDAMTADIARTAKVSKHFRLKSTLIRIAFRTSTINKVTVIDYRISLQQ